MTEKIKTIGKLILVLLGFLINVFATSYFLFNFPDPEISQKAIIKTVEKTMPAAAKEFCAQIQKNISENNAAALQKVVANPEDFKTLPGFLPNITKYIAEGGEYTVLPIGYHWNSNNGAESFEAVYEYEFEKYAATLTITAIKKDNFYLLQGMNWNMSDNVLSKTNKFEISKASGKGIAFIIFMTIGNLFAFFVWCLVVYDKGSAKRFWWLLGIPIGFSAIYLIWATDTISIFGQNGVFTFGFNMPIGGITQIHGQSAILRISFPIFALIYLWLWNKKRKTKVIEDIAPMQD